MPCCIFVKSHAISLPAKFYWIWPGRFRDVLKQNGSRPFYCCCSILMLCSICVGGHPMKLSMKFHWIWPKIHPIEWKHWSDLLRIMTRTSCLWTAKYLCLTMYLRRKEILLIFYRHFVELPAIIQPLLDYFWDIEAARNDNSAWKIVLASERKYRKYNNVIIIGSL